MRFFSHLTLQAPGISGSPPVGVSPLLLSAHMQRMRPQMMANQTPPRFYSGFAMPPPVIPRNPFLADPGVDFFISLISR